MPTPDAFDYSWARPSPKQMADAGIKVVARYLFGPGKGIDRAEFEALLNAGIGVVLNYEGASGNHLKGAAQGRIDGAAARGYALELGPRALGQPIYFSCDQQVSDAQLPTVMDYLHAADSAANESRCYGQFSVCERFGRPAWQTVAWSDGQISKHAVLYQYAIEQDFHGSDVDYNRILNIDELGACWPEGSEHDMPSAEDIAKAVWGEPLTDSTGTKQPASAWLKQARNMSDPDVLAKRLAGKLTGVTEAQIKQALTDVLKEGTG